MLLGDLIERFAEDDVATEAILHLGDLNLLSELNGRARAAGLGIGVYAAGAVRQSASQAPEEEWITLLGAMGGARDPGLVYLGRALAYAVRQQG